MEKYKKKVVEQLKNLQAGAKDMIRFEIIALSSLAQNSNLNDFFSWKEKNRELIEKEFEELCNKYGCICQQCNIGPYQGNYWISKRFTGRL